MTEPRDRETLFGNEPPVRESVRSLDSNQGPLAPKISLAENGLRAAIARRRNSRGLVVNDSLLWHMHSLEETITPFLSVFIAPLGLQERFDSGFPICVCKFILD